ncbi:L-lactate permease [Thiohalocapsa sp. ML1]|uniref:L-lactate permease n=1 Tax=Thiohalocapsa sp. ML1 TaxID=1431688 RepID=UPI000731F9D3|nr:L-lactate permease [Thiohalocapsa sp. ML1]
MHFRFKAHPLHPLPQYAREIKRWLVSGLLQRAQCPGERWACACSSDFGRRRRFGGAWPLVAPFLGELGAFFSGSATVSKLTFGPIHDAVASDLGLDRFAVLAQQAAGAGMGNMVELGPDQIRP